MLRSRSIHLLNGSGHKGTGRVDHLVPVGYRDKRTQERKTLHIDSKCVISECVWLFKK